MSEIQAYRCRDVQLTYDGVTVNPDIVFCHRGVDIFVETATNLVAVWPEDAIEPKTVDLVHAVTLAHLILAHREPAGSVTGHLLTMARAVMRLYAELHMRVDPPAGPAAP